MAALPQVTATMFTLIDSEGWTSELACLRSLLWSSCCQHLFD